jgi:ABC-2 type transport system ATP-binding protein
MSAQGKPTMNSSAMIEVRELVKQYGEVEAVRGVTFSVREGEIFGFLGPNGAGKTTTIKMLCTLLEATSGTATLAGFDVGSRASDVRSA